MAATIPAAATAISAADDATADVPTKHHDHAAEAATLVPDTRPVLLLHRLVARYHLGDCCAPLDLYDHWRTYRVADAEQFVYSADYVSEMKVQKRAQGGGLLV
jgi:hypothetical protein